MKWIKIENRLPEEDQRVIYFFEKTGIDIGRFTQKVFEGQRMNTFYGPSGWLSDDVTHWQPLPKPPLTSRSSRVADICEELGHVYYWKDGICIRCGALKPPPV